MSFKISSRHVVRFQSTHPWRVRPHTSVSLLTFSMDFNPRTHEGCDVKVTPNLRGISIFQSTHPWRVRLSHAEVIGKMLDISIHAPMKGATYIWFRTAWLSRFQSTHPWRVRRSTGLISIMSSRDFNPRTHEGCDIFKLTQSSPAFLSSILRTERKPI